MESLLTPESLAQVLGMAVQTVYNRHSLGLSLPPSIKVGRLLRFRSRDVEAWISSCYEKVENSPCRDDHKQPRKADKTKRRNR